MTKGKRPHKFVEIACPHCGSEDIVFDNVIEISTASAGANVRKVDRYVCLGCRKTFDRPRGEIMRSAPVEEPEKVEELEVASIGEDWLNPGIPCPSAEDE